MLSALANAVSREVVIDGRPHVATITAAGVVLREKGRTTSYGPVSWGHILLDGARIMAEETRRAKATRRTVRHVSRSVLGR